MRVDVNLVSNKNNEAVPIVEEEQVIKRWRVQEGRVIVIHWQAYMHFFVEKSGQRILIKPYFIEGIPANLPMQVAIWQAFLTNTSIHLKRLEEKEAIDYKLYITPQLVGGGNITLDTNKMWSGGVVPYEIDYSDFPVGTEHRAVVLAALKAWVEVDTGFCFVPRTSENNFLYFCKGKRAISFIPFDLEEDDEIGKGKEKESKKGKKKAASLKRQGLYCHSTSFSESSDRHLDSDYSQPGRLGGKQEIFCTLFNGQLNQREVMRHIASALGLELEYRRHDRDDFVTLRPHDNVESSYYKKLKKTQQVGKYDLWSIMHDPVDIRLPTGLELTLTFDCDEEWKKKIGRQAQLSSGDIAAARALFQKIHKAGMQSIHTGEIKGFCQTFAVGKSRYENDLSPFNIPIDEPQWILLKQKADRHYQQGDFREAFDDYSTLLIDYEAVIPHWLPYPLMAEMVANCYFRCGMYELTMRNDYPAAAQYVEEAIKILVNYAFVKDPEQLHFVGMMPTCDKDGIEQLEVFNSKMRYRILQREHLLYLIRHGIDPNAISYNLPPILGHTSGEYLNQDEGNDNLLQLSDEVCGMPIAYGSGRFQGNRKVNLAEEVEPMTSDEIARDSKADSYPSRAEPKNQRQPLSRTYGSRTRAQIPLASERRIPFSFSAPTSPRGNRKISVESGDVPSTTPSTRLNKKKSVITFVK